MLEPFEDLGEGAGAHLGPAGGGGDAAQEVEGAVLQRYALHDGARFFLVELGTVGVRAENRQAGAGIFERHERIQAGCVGVCVDEADLLALLRREGGEVECDGASAGCAVSAPDGHDLAEAVAGLVAGGRGGVLVDVRVLWQGAVVVLVLHVQGVVVAGCERVNDGGGLAEHGFLVAGHNGGGFRRVVCAGCTGCAGRVSSGHRGVDSVASVVGSVGRAGVYSSARGGVVAVATRPMASSSVIVTVACIVAVPGVLTVGGLRAVGDRLRGHLIRCLRGNAVACGGSGERRIHSLFERAQNLFESSFGANAMYLRGQRQVVRGDDGKEHFGSGERIHGGGAHFGGHVHAEQHAGNAGVRHADGFAEVLHGARHGDAAALGFDAGQERAVIAVEDDGDVHWPSP